MYDDDDAAIGAAFLGGPVALAHSRFDDADQGLGARRVPGVDRAFRDGAGYRVPGEFVIVTGRPATVSDQPPNQPTNHIKEHMT